MEENKNQNQNENENDNGNNTNDDSQNTGNTIPYSRFKEVNDNYKNVKQQLDDLIKKQKEDEEESKKKQGEYQQLYEQVKAEYDPLKQEHEQIKSVFNSILETKLKQIPEEYRELIPNTTEIEKLQWIESANSKGLFSKEQIKDFGNKGDNPNHSSEMTLEDFNKLGYKQRLELSISNPKLYERLSKL
ncbi:hypothetical protein [Candidatus Contubernalis alkaliaceticus]|uniref:hypothetical protein n=1 Tax=Candidatus Contubernalis alkaliaceticus TaxID=338645 RepID=UPI001F4C2ABE|nr:hypothetical protein [Candidatus Contubernalis alkalaceticus]UNC92718.1 hypothetical protein HUE98_11795 [Candidatus Contubernalis alkalaceticus]